jgi:GTP-binding protein
VFIRGLQTQAFARPGRTNYPSAAAPATIAFMPRARPESSRNTRPQTAEAPAAAPPPSRPGLLENLYPAVALVGRPNVGKSSLFNALLRREIAITDARAGTTRDRVLHPVTFGDKTCDLVDTGGLGSADRSDLTALVGKQIQAAVDSASVLVLVVDAKEGLTPGDRQIAQRLRELGRPIIVAANKSEGQEAAATVGEFSALGFDPVVAVSAAHRRGLGELEDALAASLPAPASPPQDLESLPRLAVIGRRGVGKSSFVNALARQERTIVGNQPGTTRDAVDLLMHKDRRRFWLVDTAGLRRIKEPHQAAEFYSQVRTERAIRRADVLLFMLEAPSGVSTTDLKTADLIREQFKPCVLVVNKWDLVRGVTTGEFAEYLEQRLPGQRRAPVCFTCAKTAARCWQTLDVALELYDLARTQIPTPRLNKAIERAEREHEPPVSKGHKPRLLYGVQVGAAPPTFVIRCRHAERIDAKYRRYLADRLAGFLGLEEVPLRLFLRETERN